MIAALITFVLTILALVLIGLALTNLPVWWPPSRDTRLARRTEAVRQGLEAIRQSIADRTGEPGETERAALDAEINDLLRLLPEGEGDRRAALLWPSSSAERKTFDQLIASLVTLTRALKARHDAVIGVQPGPPTNPSGVPSSSPSVAQTAGTVPAETGSGASDYRDAALLAEISKKFYESWAFKGLSVALLAGVALAVGGTFLLGGESYRLSEQLQKSYDRGASQIEKIQDQAQMSLTKQTDLLKATTAAVQTQANQFSADAAKAIATLEQKQQSFTEKLETDTVAKVVRELQQAIKDRTGAISDRIRAEEDNLQPKLDALSGRMEKLNTGTSSLETSLEKLRPHLAPLEQEASGAEQAMARIHATDTAAAQAKTQAEGYAATALQAQRDAAAIRDRVATQLDTVANGIPPQRAALDQITAAVATLQTSLQQAANSIADVTKDAAKLKEVAATVQSISGELSIVNQTLDKLRAARLEERIAALEINKPPPQPATDTGTRTFDNLSPAERCVVQRQLNSNGFGSGTIDGVFGPTTYGAIQRWQHSVGVAENGRLEAAQIDSLIGKRGVPVPPCPRR